MEGITVTLTGDDLHNTEIIKIQIEIDVTVNISAQNARRKVTAWLVGEVGNMLIGGTPQLVINRQSNVWRVPVILTSSEAGPVGQVGTVDVNAETGESLTSDTLRKHILANVERLARSLSTPVA